MCWSGKTCFGCCCPCDFCQTDNLPNSWNDWICGCFCFTECLQKGCCSKASCHMFCAALCTHFFPCYYAGVNSREAGVCPCCVGSLCLLVPVCGQIMLRMTRTKTREIYKIKGSKCDDCLMVTICMTCSINQMQDQLIQPKPGKEKIIKTITQQRKK